MDNNRINEVGRFLCAELRDARQNSWESFTLLVEHLARLEDLGCSLADRESRAGHTYQFEIKDRILELKPQFLDFLADRTEKLDNPNPRLIQKIWQNLETSKLFNKHHMYAPDRSERINEQSLRDSCLVYGVHALFQKFREEGSFSYLNQARDVNELTGRNFSKEVERELGIGRQELSSLIRL